jgi:uroporphyrinogen decarboxylase
MYGATFRDGQNREGTRAYVLRPINAVGDWNKIVPLDSTNPVFVRELAALKIIRDKLGANVPILQTIFSPLNSAHNLAGERLFADLRTQPAALHRALANLAETTTRFALASLRAGADSAFFATQMATRKFLGELEFREFGEKYDLTVLNAIRHAKHDFVLLHIHGVDTFFDLLAKYPVDAVNWHDRRTAPSLKDAQAKFKGTLVGGINEWDTLAAKSSVDVKAEARDAIRQTDGRRFILGAGCVISVDTSEENINAVLQAADLK